MNNKIIQKFYSNFIVDSVNVGDRKEYLLLLNEIDKLLKYFEKIDVAIQDRIHVNESIFIRKVNKYFKNFEKIESRIKNKSKILRIKHLFRSLIFKYIKQSHFIKRGVLKPRGYPGDYQILEYMYNNKPKSKNFGRLLDIYFLSNDYVQAVRDRKDDTRIIISTYLKSDNCRPKKILNLA